MSIQGNRHLTPAQTRVGRRACSPSRTCSISSRTNSPAWVEGNNFLSTLACGNTKARNLLFECGHLCFHKNRFKRRTHNSTRSASHELRPRKNECGVNLISDAPPFGRLWYDGPDAISNAVDGAKFYSRSHLAWRDYLWQRSCAVSKIISPKGSPVMKTLAQRRRNVVDLTKRARGVLKASINLVQQRWAKPNRLKDSTSSIHIYEIRPRADKHGFDLSSDALPYSPLWYRGPNAIRDAIGCATHRSRSHDAVIHVYDAAGNVIETHEHKGDFREW